MTLPGETHLFLTRRRAVCFALPALFAMPLSALAQTDGQVFTLSVSAQVVTVPVTVRDSKGALVQTLTKDDFTLTEDGKPQTIRYLSVDRNRALTLALMVDTSGSQKDLIAKERTASNTFLKTLLTKEGDTAFLIRFDDAITMLQKPTESKDELQAALTHLEDPHKSRYQPPAKDLADYLSRPPSGTLFYDALYLTCDKGMQDVQGRNAVVVLTDGNDRGSDVTLDQAIEAAQRSNTVVYSILYSTEQTSKLVKKLGGEKVTGKDVLIKLSTATGGHMYEVSLQEPLEKIFDTIAEEMRMQYVLAYTPAKSDSGHGFRKIELTPKDKTWKVETRSGYYYSGVMGEGEE